MRAAVGAQVPPVEPPVAPPKVPATTAPMFPDDEVTAPHRLVPTPTGFDDLEDTRVVPAPKETLADPEPEAPGPAVAAASAMRESLRTLDDVVVTEANEEATLLRVEASATAVAPAPAPTSPGIGRNLGATIPDGGPFPPTPAAPSLTSPNLETLPALRVAVLATGTPGDVRIVPIELWSGPPGAALAMLVPISGADAAAIAKLFR